MSQIFVASIQQLLASNTGKIVILLLPVFIPLMFLVLLWTLRLRWLTLKFVFSQTPCLLEIRLPKEILKSPAGMEIFFSYLAQGGAANYTEIFLDGKTRPWFSCEIVSIEGEVKFYVWCSQEKFKTVVEAQLYAQYPNIEVHEVPLEKDYVNLVPFDMEKYFIWGMQFALTNADPYPIKTYIDYGLNEDSKDEYKIDPLTAVLEHFGSMKKGEYSWLQILVQKHEVESWKHGIPHVDYDEKKHGFIMKGLTNILGKSRKLKDEIKTEIEKVRESAIPKPKPGEENSVKFPNPTKGQNEIIAALERHASKTPFDCMIRGMYLAEKTSFNAVNIGGMIGSLRQYGSNHMNGFKGGFFPDVTATRKDIARFLPFLKKGIDAEVYLLKKELFHAYKLRSAFQLPYKKFGNKPFILTTEELATIFHFPSGIVSKTPTLKRVESKKSEAPSNLPI